MNSPNYDYLDGDARAGELSRIFAVDRTTAAGQCAECGTTKCLAEARVTCMALVSWRDALPATHTSSSCECSRAYVS